jgi:hypothetical protein
MGPTYFGEERDPLRPVRALWYDGSPGHIDPSTVWLDLAAYRSLRCQCGHRGMKLAPQHTMAGSYRIVAECKHCGQTEVL